MISDPQTIWTLIPRGFRNGKPFFSVYVSASLAPISPEPALADTCWLDWYNTVAQVIEDRGGQFLQIREDGGGTTPLALTGSLPFPQKPKPNDGSPANALLVNRQALWTALTKTPPFQLGGAQTSLAQQRPGAQPSLADWSTGVTSSNAGKPTSSTELFKQAWKLQKTLYREYFSTSAAKSPLKSAGKRPPTQGSFQVGRVDTAELNTFKLAVSTQIDDARFVARTPDEIDDTLSTEISTWIMNATVGERPAARALERDLARLSRNPYKNIHKAVLYYLYNKRRTQAGTQGQIMYQPGNQVVSDANSKRPWVDRVLFHRRVPPPPPASQVTSAAVTPLPSPSAVITYTDFLKSLNQLSHYPALLYCLGLAFDVEAESIKWKSETRLSIAFVSDDVATALGTGKKAQPRTAVIASGYPADATSTTTDLPVSGGLLQLSSGFETSIHDFDGYAMRQNLNSDTPARDQSGEFTDGILPMRSAGISVMHANLPDMLIGRVQSHTTRRGDPTATPLYARDLVRGFSPEVQRGEDWVSLTARSEDVRFGPDNPVPLLAEPHERPHSPLTFEATFSDDHAPGGTPVNDPHIGGALFRWPGWSLSVPHPFGVATQSNPESTDQQVIYPVVHSYSLPNRYKSPRLRFGGPDWNRKISPDWLRARALDLLGNPIEAPLPLSPPDPHTNALCVTYLRQDPIPPPELLADATFDPRVQFGEHIDAMAVRDGNTEYQPTRYLCPPVAPLLSLIEQGAMDRTNLAGAIDGELKSPFSIGSFNDVQLDLEEGKVGLLPRKTVNGVDFQVYETPTSFPADGAYLPDTFAHNLTVQLQDIASATYSATYFGPIEMSSFYGSADLLWPEATHIRIRLKPGDNDDASRQTVFNEWVTTKVSHPVTRNIPQLNVYLPKGWQVTLMLSCAPTVDQVKRMDCNAGDTGSSDGADLIVRGLSTTHNPVRTVTLVHAVKQPLADSYFVRDSPPLVKSDPDSPATTISGTFRVGDGRSTGACVVTMQWDEYIDNPALPEPQKIPHTESLVQIPNYKVQDLPPLSGETLPVHWQHDLDVKPTIYKFSDGSFRQIHFGVDSVSRFQNFFAAPATQATMQAAAQGGSVPPSPYVRTSNPRLAVSVSRLNTKTPDTVSFSHALPLLPVFPDVPVPKGSYRRFGGAFRIHLKRGWYSTGAGERLGLVLVPDAQAQCGSTGWEADELRSHLFTRWGADPMWDASAVPDNFQAAPLGTDFIPPAGLACFVTPKIVPNVSGIDPTGPVILATYAPVFTQTDGWYCDVFIRRVPAYNYFVRLAMVRYQEQSVQGRSVSAKVVTAPFIPLQPDRAVRIVRGQAKHEFHVGVYGTPGGLDASGNRTQFSLVVEVEKSGIWVPDSDCSVDPFTPNTVGSGRTALSPIYDANDPIRLLTGYSLTIKKHAHRKRRVRVDEQELRLGYDPASFQPSAPSPFLISLGRPVKLP